MKKITFLMPSVSLRNRLLIVLLISCSISFGQTTVFSDNFNRGNLNPGPNGLTYSSFAVKNDRTPQTIATASFAQIVSDAPAGATGGASAITFNDNALNLLQGGTGDLGTISISAPLTTHAAPFSAALASNTGLVTWTFNLRTNRGNATGSGLSGFALDGTGTNYGMAVVLAGSNANLMLGTGYVVTFNQFNSSSSNVVSLRKYSDGVNTASTNSSMTPIITIPVTAALANRWNFCSVKVTYNPVNSEWSLFLRDDGDATWGNPTTVTSQVGATTVDSEYTATALTHFGFLFKHANNNATQNQAFYDNYQVTIGPSLATNTFDKIKLSVYPNPANRELTIFNDSGIQNVSVLNMLGQELQRTNCTNTETTVKLDITNLKPANYLIKVTTTNGFAISKFIKM